MNTEILRADHPSAFDHAVDILRNGGLVAFPTDTIYGVAAQLYDPTSIESLFAARGRGSKRSVGILFADMSELPAIVARVTPEILRLAQRFWPGPLTLVMTGHADLPLELLRTNSADSLLTGLTTPVAVRIPSHRFALELLHRSGPLAVSSASRVAGPNPKSAQDVIAQMNGRIHLLLDGGPVPGGIPSTVIDCTQEPLVELRQGPIAMTDILDVVR